MKSTTTFDVVLVPFPFSDLSSVKKRPCLVLKRYEVRKLGSYLVVGMITSQIEGISFPGDITLKDWEEAGLPKPSLVRLSKIVSIGESFVRGRLGSLSATDQRTVNRTWKEWFVDLGG